MAVERVFAANENVTMVRTVPPAQPRLHQSHRSQRTYPERVREALSSTEATYAGGDGCLDHFGATEPGWRLTYEPAYSHQIRIAFPPEGEDQVRSPLLTTIHSMGCDVLSTTTHRGQPVWDYISRAVQTHPAR